MVGLFLQVTWPTWHYVCFLSLCVANYIMELYSICKRMCTGLFTLAKNSWSESHTAFIKQKAQSMLYFPVVVACCLCFSLVKCLLIHTKLTNVLCNCNIASLEMHHSTMLLATTERTVEWGLLGGWNGENFLLYLSYKEPFCLRRITNKWLYIWQFISCGSVAVTLSCTPV